MSRKQANTKKKKAAKDTNNSRIYAKFGVEVYVTVKSGNPDPHANQKLRFVIEHAKTYNVPKHIIDRTTEEAKGSTGEQYSELHYEGFEPNGLVVIVDTLTNNVNRTTADARAAFGKNGGNVGISGAVSYMFNNTGVIGFAGDDADGILEYLMEKGIDVRDVVEEDGQVIVYTEPEDFHHAREVLREKGIEESTVTGLEMVPRNEVTSEGDGLANFEKMLDVLEDLEDIQEIHHSVDLPE